MEDTGQDSETVETVAGTLYIDARMKGYAIGFYLLCLIVFTMSLINELEVENSWLVLVWAGGFVLSLVQLVSYTFGFLGWLVGSYIDAMQESKKTDQDQS